MKNRKIKDRLMSSVVLFYMLILGWVLYILINEIKADLPKTAKFFQVLGYVGVGFGIVTCVIRFLIGKPLIKTSLDKQMKTQQSNKQIEDKIDDDLKVAWQAAIAWSMFIMIIGILAISLILCHKIRVQ
ncbi:hypothetical protein [Limosilactobacillus reuteri]|uniref:hypothetical protein n=1 Tax=Limosilactobacillus reuteri TaxID=1598 RepID=UPI00273E43DD|nr:hypothetical protein [Limosilactobacillus reuteri]WLR79490.1 hypothetical protein Q3A95_09970 [Limosilactobacillus reuteri]